FHAQGDVVDQFFFQTLFDVTAGDELTFFTGKRRIVDLERHAHGRFIHAQGGQGFNGRRVTQCVGDAQAVDTGNTDDVASAGFGGHNAVEEIGRASCRERVEITGVAVA